MVNRRDSPSEPGGAEEGLIARYRANLQDETDSAALYRGLAADELDRERAEIFAELARAEERHSAVWQAKLELAGDRRPAPRPSCRIAILLWLAGRFGTRSVLGIAGGMERLGTRSYGQQAGAAELADEERAHERTLAQLERPAAPGVHRLESWHRSGGGGSLRAAIFGVNDGLLSNTSLILGVAGAGGEPRFVLLAGVAGLLAGAFSMAAGEYVSMGAQRDLLERQVGLERAELEANPEEERAELIQIYQAKGVPAASAEQLVEVLMRDPRVALDTLAREELGLDPGELGSPWGAAIFSFLAFAGGAIVPLVPFALIPGPAALVVTAAISAVTLFLIGASLSLFTGTHPLLSGGRMLVIGTAAATVTYLAGSLFGVAVG
ncbi:MAG: VIT1/CCC1 transporter family protein [Chloroflexi bacterium]|nr:VIT1/CCC1 transporter family protein [Chloroflexota bacterium]